MEVTVQFEESDTKGRAYLDQDGATVGEMTYSKAGADLIIIDHTEVAESMRGKMAGKKLLVAVVEMAREKGIKIMPLCPFARAMFQKDASLRDVLK